MSTLNIRIHISDLLHLMTYRNGLVITSSTTVPELGLRPLLNNLALIFLLTITKVNGISVASYI